MRRRDFLALASSLLAPTVGTGRRTRSQRVEAEVTIFYAQPDGRANLVRFRAAGVPAPAGRLRVYQGRRLLGTAGMIGTDEGLYGELWLPLERATRVSSELEAPGLRRAVRSTHLLHPGARWALYWLPLTDASTLAGATDDLDPVGRGVYRALLLNAGAMSNPLPAPEAVADVHHVEFLRLVRRAGDALARHGIPISPVGAIASPEDWPATTPIALRGSGIELVARPWDGGAPLAWWQAPDGSRVLLAAIPPGGHPPGRMLLTSAQAAAPWIERWIAGLPAAFLTGNDSTRPWLLLLDTDLGKGLVQRLTTVRDWNRRYAYPQIVVGGAAELAKRLARAASDAIPIVTPSQGKPPPHEPEPDALRHLPDETMRDRARRATALFAPLVELLEGGPTMGRSELVPAPSVFATIAAHVNTRFSGTLLFNPTPWLRTDVAVTQDGTELIATDVPGLGWTGAIRSLMTRDDGLEWVREGSGGLNVVSGGLLDDLEHQPLRRVGARVAMRRWSPVYGAVRTMVTLYDALPWIDIENEAETLGDGPLEYLFHFALERAELAWEVPAGYATGLAPAAPIRCLRWLRLQAGGRAAVLASAGAHDNSVTADGTVASHAARGRTRYRLLPTAPPGGLERAWAAGFTTEPLIAVPVEGRTTGRLPRFAELLTVQPQGAAAVVRLKPADDGDGLVLYLLTPTTAALVSIAGGLLRFDSARRVDFLERDLGAVAGPSAGVVLANLPGRSAAAVRLRGVGLNL